jgi:hypothetical protein
MAAKDQHADPTENKEMGSAGHETGAKEPSAMGTAGIYATKIHEEREEAEEAAHNKAD